MISSLKDLRERARSQPPVPIVVAAAENAAVLESVAQALKLGIVKEPVLVGDSEVTEEMARVVGLDMSNSQLVPAGSPKEAARAAVQALHDLGGGLLMKGLIGTGDLLRAVLDRESGLRTGRLLSHVAVFEVPGVDRLFFLTDGGINIAPSLEEKAQITQNAVYVARALGIEQPRVAAIAALELVNPNMPATIDAACLAKMAERGQITGALVDGPLGLDNAVSEEAAKIKRIASPVAGKADVLLVPDIETGNTVYKALMQFGHAGSAGLVTGAKVPIVLTSRADSEQAKLNSIALAALMSSAEEEFGA